ncbi:restriction endonuclease (plasmid) [Chryseobacterium sp. SNU WT5]|uniref:restriction endonuclease n=1 Tax=Chryseobacterium sp. SNU WT5 TaxID=2594269 RepID=UPI00117DC740|nr:restriction endonuclease [Chryseobacterium sp. SNU WT5]QDP86710.1 restriction endonuclease [Chryseobacterium sp. SNU WT5]
MKDKDFINIEILESILNYITDDIRKQFKSNLIYDNRTEYLLDINKYERSSVLLANYYQVDLNGKDLADTLLKLVYDTLNNPYFIFDSDDNFHIENTLVELESEENFMFNNPIYSWFDYSDWSNNHTSELKYLVQKILLSNEQHRKYNLNEIDLQVYREIISNPDLAKSINWRNFEFLLAKILEKFEYEVEVLKGSKDGGIDVIALKKNSSFGNERYLIQAKKWSNKVGVDPVRQLLWAHNEYKVTKSCLITTSKFTKGAWELADKYKWQIELKDYGKLNEWIDEAVKKL